ncbi:MAG: haloalkane dehalogenase [Pseudomonadota bacterium]|nr:haloalkane dehalogenase [Pseudomonadota bacterium]MEC8292352.1 haloalkane dehalogenase [Pseudomonadota bacterium]
MPQDISAAFPFNSRFIDVKGSKIHYIDEGAGDPVLFIHGNPTSSYIWRNIMPYLQQDARVIALDLIGFGKSDKPDIAYGFQDSYAYLEGFIEALGLKNITLVVQDWGSGLGFHYANTHRDNIKGLAFMEAMYEQKDWASLSLGLKAAMVMMRARLSSYVMLGLGNMFVKSMLPQWVNRGLTAEEHAQYLAPFPTVASRKPIYVFPRDVPLRDKPEASAKAVNAYNAWLQETQIPKILFHADPGMLIPREEVPWIAENFPNITLVDIGKGTHFVQEDSPHQIGAALKDWYQGISTAPDVRNVAVGQ